MIIKNADDNFMCTITTCNYFKEFNEKQFYLAFKQVEYISLNKL